MADAARCAHRGVAGTGTEAWNEVGGHPGGRARAGGRSGRRACSVGGAAPLDTLNHRHCRHGPPPTGAVELGAGRRVLAPQHSPQHGPRRPEQAENPFNKRRPAEVYPRERLEALLGAPSGHGRGPSPRNLVSAGYTCTRASPGDVLAQAGRQAGRQAAARASWEAIAAAWWSQAGRQAGK